MEIEIEIDLSDAKPRHDKQRGNQHRNEPKHYNQAFAFAITGLMFLLLTLFTSNETFAVLPLRWFFYDGSLTIAIALCGFGFLLAAMWSQHSIPMLFVAGAGALILLAAFLFSGVIGGLGSWVLGIPYIMVLDSIPAEIFPLLMALTFGTGILCAIGSITIPQPLIEPVTYTTVLFTAVYIWGRAATFESDFYDEGLEAAGTTYHAIVYFGWLGDPGLVYLYACDDGYFGCDLLYETPDRDHYHADETQLVYDAAAGVVRLEYHMSEDTARYSDIPPVLYTVPVR